MVVTTLTVGGGGLAVASSPDAAQKKAFPALGGTPTRIVPAAVSGFIASNTGREEGVDARHVYRLPAPGGGSWSVLPGHDAICVVFENKESISTCASPEQLTAGDMKSC